MLIRAPEPQAGQEVTAAEIISQSRHRLDWLRGTKLRFVFFIHAPLDIRWEVPAEAQAQQLEGSHMGRARQFQIRPDED